MSFYQMIVKCHKIMDRGTPTKGRANHAARAGCKCKLQLLKGTDSNDVGAADRLEAAFVGGELRASGATEAKRRRQSTEICESGSCILHHARFLFVPLSRRPLRSACSALRRTLCWAAPRKTSLHSTRGWRVRHVIMHSTAVSGE